ncbi:MAG: SulP family inorganic anion transporter [Verrucomicrobiota bacterium]|nr:SulP family inorganic anion transporter [Verrucomicrobiota bacterium]
MKFIRTIKRSIREYWRTAKPDLFPLRHDLQGYTVPSARADFRAGLNVTLLVFPQAIAYASIAGLPIQNALFGAAVAAIVGPLCGGSRFVMLGPTNATAVMLFALFASMEMTDPALKAMALPAIIFLSGLFLVVGAFLRVGQLIQYISRTVVAGYITAAAIYIMVNQVPKALGYLPGMSSGTTIYQAVEGIIRHLGSVHWPSIVCALATVIVYRLMRPINKLLPIVAATLAVMSLLTWMAQPLWAHIAPQAGGPVTLHALEAAGWNFTIPIFHGDTLGAFANLALVIAFLSFLEGTSIGKSLAARAGSKIDTNREMLAMGCANLGCSFYGGVPASGSLARSQLNYDSGAVTPFSSIISGMLCLVGIFLLGPYFRFIPVPALAVVIIFTGWSLINKRVIKVVLKSTTSDAVVFVTTFVAALLIRLDFAIILGAATSILLFLRKAAIPELVEYAHDASGQLTPMEGRRTNTSISIVHVEGDLFFGASELFRDQMRRLVEDPNLRVVILKMRNAYHLDATSVLSLEELVRYMKETGRTLLVSEVRKDAIRIFRKSGLIDIIGRENIFPDHSQNPTLATARALKRCKFLLGGKMSDVSILVEKQKPNQVRQGQ